MHKLIVRSLSGIVYVAIIVGALLAGGIWTCLLALILASLAGMEFIRLTGRWNGDDTLINLTDMAATVCLAASPTGIGFILWLLLLVARLVEELFALNPEPITNLGVSVLGQIYIGLPLAVLMGVGVADYMFIPDPFTSFPAYPHELLKVMLAVFVLIWLNDTGAFCVGSLCGCHKMWERISPKKTWEGFAGGAAFCVIGAICCHFFIPSVTCIGLWQWAGLGAIVAVFATWGDLVESLFKRSLGVKDSGTLIPGHGGILDRIDSLLLVLPVSAVYIALCICF